MYFHVFGVESNFQMAVESNYAIPIATLSNWLKNSAPVFFSTNKKRNQNKPHFCG